jgi:hypothetical protein
VIWLVVGLLILGGLYWIERVWIPRLEASAKSANDEMREQAMRQLQSEGLDIHTERGKARFKEIFIEQRRLKRRLQKPSLD